MARSVRNNRAIAREQSARSARKNGAIAREESTGSSRKNGAITREESDGSARNNGAIAREELVRVLKIMELFQEKSRLELLEIMEQLQEKSLEQVKVVAHELMMKTLEDPSRLQLFEIIHMRSNGQAANETTLEALMKFKRITIEVGEGCLQMFDSVSPTVLWGSSSSTIHDLQMQLNESEERHKENDANHLRQLKESVE
nr:hypothetical protein CFP56_56394 [Quercus suber]